MAGYIKPLEELIQCLSRLPGIGPRSAERIALYLLKTNNAEAENLSQAITRLKRGVTYCHRCFNLSEAKLCSICQDSRRDTSLLCVVEEPRDVSAVEKSGQFHGLYHVLRGAISPLDNIGPDDLKIPQLLSRLSREKFKEIIIATDFDPEGESTAHYLAREIKPLGLKVSRIATGIPVGSHLEYADQATLGRALEGRQEFKI